MKKVGTITVVAVVSMLFVVGNALAWSIDFRDPYYSAADGLPSFYSDQDHLWLYAKPEGATLSWNDHTTGLGDDGFGVNSQASYEPDEIEFPEWLEVIFDNTILLSQVLITDLFQEKNHPEHGMFKVLIGGTWSQMYDFWADPTQVLYPASNGQLIVNLADYLGGVSFVKGIAFAAWGSNPQGPVGWHEFSVAALNTVPEPGTMVLLGAGLIGVFALARKHKK